MVRKTRPAQGPGPPREQSPPPLPAALSPSPATPSRALTDPTVARGPDFEFTGPPPAAGSPLASDGHVRYQSAPAILGSAAPRPAPPPPPARPPLRPPPPARGSAPFERKQSAAGGRLSGGGGARILLGHPGHPCPVFPERVCVRVCECVHVFLHRIFYD